MLSAWHIVYTGSCSYTPPNEQLLLEGTLKVSMLPPLTPQLPSFKVSALSHRLGDKDQPELERMLSSSSQPGDVFARFAKLPPKDGQKRTIFLLAVLYNR
jgi:hypothetical protein